MEAVKSIGAGSEEWALAHDALSNLCLKRGALDAEEGQWLLRALRAATHAYFGYASFGEYVERLFGLGRRATEEKLRVATALEGLPELEQALRSGRLNWSTVREVSRVASPDTEREWIAEARGKTVREVERLVSGLAPGDRPKDPRRAERVRHVLRFEVGAETLAAFREAMRLLQKRSEHRLNDDEALLSMAREVLGGPRDAGRASYQVVVTRCEDCRRGFQHAGGELVELDPAIVEMCQCDAQKVVIAGASDTGGIDADMRDVGKRAESDAHVSADGKCTVSDAHVSADGQASECDVQESAAVERAGGDARVSADGRLSGSNARVGGADKVDGGNAHAHVGIAGESTESDEHVRADGQAEGRSDASGGGAEKGEPSDIDEDVASELAATRRTASERTQKTRKRTAIAGGRAGVKRPRATQVTPPAVRREVFFRDRGRCVVPGCRNATYVDLHHLELRSEWERGCGQFGGAVRGASRRGAPRSAADRREGFDGCSRASRGRNGLRVHAITDFGRR